MAGERDRDAPELDGVALLRIDVSVGDPVAQDVLERLGLALRGLAAADDVDAAESVEIKDERPATLRIALPSSSSMGRWWPPLPPPCPASLEPAT
jgi:hypothetical protein